MLALVPNLLFDLNTQPIDFALATDASPVMVEANGVRYFAADDGVHGFELWKTNGTATGTQLVADIAPGITSANPNNLVNFAGKLYFTASDGVNGAELWSTDGTSSGTVLVRDIQPGTTGSNPQTPLVVDGTMYFTADALSVGRELWKTDGTSAGTVLVRDVFPSTFGDVRYLTNVGGTIFFRSLSTGIFDHELWKTDGTSAGTVLVRNINPATSGINGSDASNFVNVNNVLFFRANDGTNGMELWRSDGTSAGTQMVSNLNATGSSNPNNLINLGGSLLFSADDGTLGSELYTVANPGPFVFPPITLVSDISSGAAGSAPTNLTIANGIVYFAADNGVVGNELWRSDGTSAGTFLVRDVHAGLLSSSPSALTNVNGKLFFGATGPGWITDRELWTSDGTSTGTTMVVDLAAGTSIGADPIRLANANGTLFFSGFDTSNTKRRLFTSDGTAPGTTRILPATPPDQSARIGNVFQLGAITYFAASNGLTGLELWRTDGTCAGTSLVRDINPGFGDSNPDNFANVNGILYFSANNGTNGSELWRSDGTSTGTFLVSEIAGGGLSSNPKYLTNVNGTLLFAADSINEGVEPWISDGTSAGTRILADLVPGTTNSSNPRNFTVVGSTVYFTAAGNKSLYQTNLTSVGTTPIRTFVGASAAIRDAAGFLYLNTIGRLLFVANDGTNGDELWTSDGTSFGTQMVANLNPSGGSNPNFLTLVGSNVFFSATNGTSGTELFVTDGTSLGTTLVRNIAANTASSSPQSLVNVGNTLYFSADDGVNGRELWRSDGSSLGTTLVADLTPGSGGSAVANLFNSTNGLLFTATVGTSGTELWNSDGTSLGTVLVADLFPGLGSSQPVPFVVNGETWVAASDGVLGRELYRLVSPGSFPNVSIAVSSASMSETGGAVTVFAQLSQTSTSTVTVNLSFSGAAVLNRDFTTSSAAIVINAGQLTGSITLASIQDPYREGPETIAVDIASVSGANVVGASSLPVTIIDDAGDVDPFEPVGVNELIIHGSAGNDAILINYGSSTTTFTASVNGVSNTFARSVITIDGHGGRDTLTGGLSSLADTATLVGTGGSLTSSNYAFTFANLEVKFLFGGVGDRSTFNDAGGVSLFYALPTHAIMLDSLNTYLNETISFGEYVGNGAGNDDYLFLYDAGGGGDNFSSTPTRTTLTVGSVTETGNGFRHVLVQSFGGGDTVTYNGSAANETMASVGSFYSVVNSSETTQYFVSIPNVVVNSGGGLDQAVFYDSIFNDTFTSDYVSAVFTGAGFSNRAIGYTQVYAFSYFGGQDVANLTGWTGDDSLYSGQDFVIMSTASIYVQQALNFFTVNVNSVSGTDNATIDDFVGNDTLNTSGAIAELVNASGRRVQLAAFDTVFARSVNGGVNVRVQGAALQYLLTLDGLWL